jgi:chaperonin GroES
MLKFKALKPLMNRILIEKAKPVNKTKAGLLLDKPNTMSIGNVIAVGEGAYQNGIKVPMGIKVGQTVMLPEYGGSIFKLADGKEYCIYRDDDILGVLEEEVKD